VCGTFAKRHRGIKRTHFWSSYMFYSGLVSTSMARDGLQNQRFQCEKRGIHQVTVNYHTDFNSKKVKFTLEQATKAPRGVEIELYSFFNLGARWVGGQRVVSAVLPPGMTRYPFIGGWVCPRAGLDGCGKFRPHRVSIPRPSSP